MTDRLAEWVLRFFAKLILIIGISLLVPSVLASGMSSDFPPVKAIFGYFLELGVAFVVAGGLALYLSRQRGFLLPNEREVVLDEERPEFGGWLIALAIFLAAWPALIIIGLQSLRSEWDRVIILLVSSGFFEGLDDPLSGIVAIPVALALTPAMIEFAAMVAFIGTSAMLLPLLLLRSPLFPRLYVVCVSLLVGFVVASFRAADGMIFVVDAIEDLMRNSNARPEDIAQAREVIGQHAAVVSSTARTLFWSLCGYLIWLPALSFSRQVSTTYARRVNDHSIAADASNIESITRPPRG